MKPGVLKEVIGSVVALAGIAVIVLLMLAM